MYALGVLYAVRFPVCFQINLMFLDANDDDSDQSGDSFMHFLGPWYLLLSASSCIICLCDQLLKNPIVDCRLSRFTKQSEGTRSFESYGYIHSSDLLTRRNKHSRSCLNSRHGHRNDTHSQCGAIPNRHTHASH